MNILLTGASGFIGNFLCGNSDIKRIVLREGGNYNNWGCERFYIKKLDGRTGWKGAFKGIDSIIHLAGVAHSKDLDKSVFKSVNTEGTLKLANEAASFGVKRFVFVSSIGVNGKLTQSEPFKFKMKPDPDNAYAQSKYNAELGLKKIAEETGLEVVIVRPTLVYGSNAPGNFGLLTNLVKMFPVLPFGLTKNRRDFIAVQNLTDLLVTCASHPNANGHTFLASDGETVSTKEFTNAIAQGLGKKVIQLPIPISLMRFVGKLVGRSSMIEQLVGNLEVDSSNLKKVLNWTPPFTMEQAMANLRTSGTK